jgi:iron(III) transport system substrate-binding protein
VRRFVDTSVVRLAGLLGLALTLAPFGAAAQTPRPWLDPTLLAAAKAEGPLVVYSSTNEREGLELFKLFEAATGIKVEYVRASDSVLMSRLAIETRANQKSFDIIHTTTVNKIPAQILAQFDPREAGNLSPEARDKDRRWYGVYTNYNTPAYNSQHVKAEDLPKTYEEFATRTQWAGKVAIDGTDNEWLKAMFEHFGEARATKLIKDMVAALKPVIVDGHLALARSNGSGEYWVSLNNYANLSLNVKLGGSPIEIWAMDPVAVFFGQVGVNAKSANPNAARLAANFLLSQEAQQFYTKFGRLPTRKDVESNPPGVVQMITRQKQVAALLTPEEDRKWQRTFEQLFKGR